MIVNYRSDGWEIITQGAHGNLAAQVASHWKVSKRPTRWMETLLAIAEHDDHQIEFSQADVLTSAGGPKDFKKKIFEKKKCEELIHKALCKGQYIALLTSLHLDFLYSKPKNIRNPAKSFLKQQSLLRKELCSSLKITISEAKSIYCMLEWCDALSLILCQREAPPEHRLIQISTLRNKQASYLKAIKEDVYTITPWPFEDQSFFVNVETRVVKRLRFENAEAFRKALMKAAVESRTFRFVKEL